MSASSRSRGRRGRHSKDGPGIPFSCPALPAGRGLAGRHRVREPRYSVAIGWLTLPYGCGRDPEPLLQQSDNEAGTCQSAVVAVMSFTSRSRLGHASRRLAVQGPSRPSMATLSSLAFAFSDYRHGIDQAAFRTFGLVSDILGSTAAFDGRGEKVSAAWFARNGVVASSDRFCRWPPGGTAVRVGAVPSSSYGQTPSPPWPVHSPSGLRS